MPAASYGYDANDRLLSDSYDANGNTTVSAGVNYGFDFENRLASQTGTVVGNAYDGDGNRGNRVSKTVGGVTTSVTGYRPTTLAYPASNSSAVYSSGRTLTYSYGSTSSTADAVNRLDAIRVRKRVESRGGAVV